MQVLNLDQYLKYKEKNVVQIFIFLLNEEYRHFNTENTWLQELKYPTYIVRMGEDDFNRMDISIHPKIFCTKAGKELFDINGLPTFSFLKAKIRSQLQ
jgi:hypothetical protein